MTDNRFSASGFKYPERIYGQKFQHSPALKPALLSQVKKQDQRPSTMDSMQLLFKKQTVGASKQHSDQKDLRSPFKQTRFSKFGKNLGPDRPVQPQGKF